MNINDIARIAGVGVGTVSRVINNHPDVKDETRKRIQKIIEESNYIPNSSARNLKKTNSNTIGVLVRGVFNPFFSEMIDVIGKLIAKNGYTMVLRHTDFSSNGDEELRDLISFEKARKLQGIIYLGCDIREVTEDTFSAINVPLVLSSVNINYNIEAKNFSSIGIKQRESAYKATKYLIDNNNKRIAIMIGIKNDAGLAHERLLGYIEALAENNITLNKDYILYGEYSAEGAYKATSDLINKGLRVEGVFCISDIMATGCAKAFVDNNFEVGKDVSVIGFDGMEVAEFYNPAITTIEQPRKEMAEKTVDLLLDLIKHNSENKHIILDTKLIERDSCKKNS